jgi:hypothetical protein
MDSTLLPVAPFVKKKRACCIEKVLIRNEAHRKRKTKAEMGTACGHRLLYSVQSQEKADVELVEVEVEDFCSDACAVLYAWTDLSRW